MGYYTDWFNKKKSRTQVMAYLYISIVIDIAGYSLLIPLVPYIVTELQGGSIEVGICFSGYAICQLISSFVFGRISDKYGRRPCLLICFVGQCIGTLVQANSHNIWLYVTARVLTGLFDNSFTLCQSCIADLTNLSERATYLAQVDAVYSCGFVIGPVIGGILSNISLILSEYCAVGFFILSSVFAYLTLNETMKFAIERNSIKNSIKVANRNQDIVEAEIQKNKLENLNTMVSHNKSNSKIRLNIFIILAVVEEFCNKWVLSANDTCFGLFGEQKFGLTSLVYSLTNAGEGFLNVIQQSWIYDFFLNKLNLPLTSILILGGLLDVVAVFVVAFAPNLPVAIFGIFLMIGGYGFASPGAPSIVSTESDADSQGQALAIVQFGGQCALGAGPLILGALYDVKPELPFLISSIFGFLLIILMIIIRRLPGGKYVGVVPTSEAVMDSLVNSTKNIGDKDVELSKMNIIKNNEDDTVLQAITPVNHYSRDSDEINNVEPYSQNLLDTSAIDTPFIPSPFREDDYI
ncbi:hypothetical protein WA158_007202 [Blastocystis sp. Blastoise]